MFERVIHEGLPSIHVFDVTLPGEKEWSENHNLASSGMIDVRHRHGSTLCFFIIWARA